MPELPMFPLGSVLFPEMLLPLDVFEPRYRQMMARVLDTDGEFGVVLIKRGSEVGGGDVRSSVGTVARVLEFRTFDDGQSMILVIGTRRMWVERWLPDDPYPMADIQFWPDAPAEVDPRLLAGATARLHRALELAAKLGASSAPLDLSSDPAIASMQIAARAPLSSLDKQKLLRSPGAVRRLTFTSDLLDEAIELLEFRLGLT